MKVYILILSNPLDVSVYSSLTALYEDNGVDILKASLSKLQKWDWSFNYIAHNVIISKKEMLSTGDVRRKQKKDSEK